MKQMFIVAGLAGLLSMGVLFAQSEATLQPWMKTLAATNGSLQKNLAAKDSAAATADAMKLKDTFMQVEMFFKAKGLEDAVGFAQKGAAAAMAVQSALTAGNMDQAMADGKTIGPNCGGCHMAHREKTDSGFKLKE